MATKFERIEVELPQDILFAMGGLQKEGDIKRELKIALAIVLLQERVISLGKATELAEMSRVRFIELLKRYGISAYVYREKDLEKDQQMIVKIKR